MQFRPGAVCEFKQVHNVTFYADVPKGRIQMEEGETDRAVERAAPVRKRKSSREPAGHAFKARSLEMELDDDGENADEDNGNGDSYLDWHVAKHDVYGEQFCTSWEAADEGHEDMDDFNLDELHDALDDAALIDE
ncbi:Proline rich antigen 2 [Phytophthora cinnamomi]|uniref:Proline rich antigen 2 n=1 Tax=Phytophthora cinnamomi TaxID=4785 RepID=UPI0035595055|nr:Proline rich antigen 2 [Phytophthora cinnamomi]